MFCQDKRVAKWNRILLIETLLFIVLLIEGKKIFTPQKEALTFFNYMANGNYEAAYGELEIEESEFINEDMFVKSHTGERFGTVSDYYVKSERNIVGESGFADDQDMSGKTVIIDYRIRGSMEKQVYPVNLVRQMGKKYLLFHDWKVNAGDMIAENCSIVVPENSSVIFDGVELDDTYLRRGGKMQGGFEGVCYTIPQIFRGRHFIQISMENKKTITADIEIWDDDQYTIWNIDWEYDIMAQHIQEAELAMQQICQAAMSGQDFDSVSFLFTKDAEHAESLRDRYNNLVSLLEDNGESDTIQAIRFHDLEGEVFSAINNCVNIKGLYDLEIVSMDERTGKTESSSIQNENFNGKIAFGYEDEGWVLTFFEFDCP